MSAKAVEAGLGRILHFVKFIISDLPITVVTSGCLGGVAASGDTKVPGTNNCIGGSIAALKIMVYWSGLSNVVRFARPSAAAAYALRAECRLLKTSPIWAHTSLLGRLCFGNLCCNAAVIVSESGTLVVSSRTSAACSFGLSHHVITATSVNSLSDMESSTVSIDANLAKFQIGIRVSL